MDIFCDIYFVLIENKEEHLDRRLLNLLQTVRLSVTISRLFNIFLVLFSRDKPLFFYDFLLNHWNQCISASKPDHSDLIHGDKHLYKLFHVFSSFDKR